MNCYFIGPFELELETLNYKLEIELRVRDPPPPHHRRGSMAIKKIDAEDTTCLGEVAAESRATNGAASGCGL